MRKALLCVAMMLACPTSSFATEYYNCSIPKAYVEKILHKLYPVTNLDNRGIFSPNWMWASVVDRKGKLCGVAKSGDAWPGSRAIAIAKANTANAFSNAKLALSTANLYSATQPGGTLYGLNNSNPFNPESLEPWKAAQQYPGGIITFGGGTPLYFEGNVIGGLGVSGDSACTDHVIAYRMRRLAGFDKIPGGVGYNGTDNIDYYNTADGPNGFKHPHCSDKDLAPGEI